MVFYTGHITIQQALLGDPRCMVCPIGNTHFSTGTTIGRPSLHCAVYHRHCSTGNIPAIGTILPELYRQTALFRDYGETPTTWCTMPTIGTIQPALYREIPTTWYTPIVAHIRMRRIIGALFFPSLAHVSIHMTCRLFFVQNAENHHSTCALRVIDLGAHTAHLSDSRHNNIHRSPDVFRSSLQR